jgi:hypothetical protein
MTLVNFKKSPENLLRILMSLVFLSAGLFRIMSPGLASLELQNLYLPAFFSLPLIFLEIGGGFYLLIKGKYWRQVLLIFIIFLALALINALRVDFAGLLKNVSELFVFNLTPTDFFLHFVFLIILLFLFWKKN